MRKIWYILSIVLLLIIFGFKTPNNKNAEIPQGTYQIDSNLYIDVLEITNLEYREYLYWLNRVFGANSSNYKNALPDTSVWTRQNIKYKVLNTLYFRHPELQNYPVVGVSYQQAKDFTQWRSDRVFEYTLIKNKEIKFKKKQDLTNYFSIEKFLSGKYHKAKPKNTEYNIVIFSLPTEAEWKKALAKSYELSKNAKYPEKYNKYKSYNNIIINSIEKTQDGSSEENGVPTISIEKNAMPDGIYNLQGNIAEITETQKCIGGSWKEPINDILTTKPYKYTNPRADIGFRNVAKWTIKKVNL
jgi:formylglycine-generating enzyme required for sulfatase activity